MKNFEYVLLVFGLMLSVHLRAIEDTVLYVDNGSKTSIESEESAGQPN